jgi:hypothetical protein
MKKKTCFIAMPFKPELNYFFLYIKHHLEEDFSLLVERGNARILTKPLMDKIREQILGADLIIGDITGKNPNVFYEIGLAHAVNKPVIFLTQEVPEEAPVDIRQFEFILYDLGRHEEFLARLDNAVKSFFGTNYEPLYEEAKLVLKQFNADSGLACSPSLFEEFQAKVMKSEQTSEIPSANEKGLRLSFLLLKVISDMTDPKVVSLYSKWVS